MFSGLNFRLHRNAVRVTSAVALATFFLTFQAKASPTTSTIGVSDNKILIGSSVNLTGPSSERPKEIMRGSNVVFKKVNAAGGIHGRKIEMIVYDDQYDPLRSLENAKQLVNKDKAFALFGFFGAPNSKAVQPWVAANGIPFIAPGSGLESLRNPVVKNIFNVRLSYAQEVEPVVEELVKNRGVKDISVLYQEDALGQEVLQGVQRVLGRYKLSIKSSAGWTRSTNLPIDAAYETIKKGKPQAVIMGLVFKPAAEFVKKAKADKMEWAFGGPTSLATAGFLQEAGAAAEGTLVSNAFPPVETKFEIIRQMQADAAAVGEKETVNVEGYLSALAMVEALKRAGKNLTRESFIAGFESMGETSLAGMRMSFSSTDHQGLKRAYLSVVKDGKFVLLSE